MIAEVIVDIGASEVDRVFDYSIGDLDGVVKGCRVLVPFGRFSVGGFVVGVKPTSSLALNKIKNIIKVLDELPAITSECLALAEFVRDKYHVSFASSLRLFLPSEMRTGKVHDKVARYCVLNEGLTKEEMISSLRKGSSARIGAIEYLSENGKTPLALLNEKFGNSAVKALTEKGFITITEEKLCRSPYSSINVTDKKVSLTDRQNMAIESFYNSPLKTHLLHGVTGSGKTEVYLNVIEKTVLDGKTAIMLVPEIALTPQMLKQLRGRFGDWVSILHSGLSAGERFDEWWRLRSGVARIAIGARSAVFAPLENLGVIIIDEEHDGSYDSESSPRYKTLTVAEKRAEISGCKLILGSATPQIDSYKKAKEGKYNLIEMPDRINKKQLPEVIIADMRREVRRGNNSCFSSVLKQELEECLNEGNQAIIFLNRRGYSQQVICKDCGYVPKCKDCDVSLNYHSVGNVLKCHYCGLSYRALTGCPECGSVNMGFIGTGTQRVVEDLAKLFPQAKVLRMDNDTTRNKEGHFEIIKQFADKKADILVGTQMIAKGHDFPSVTLVGILDADMSLYFSDYRSGERTFQLITQVAGRSGRADKQGKVVMQTYSPDNAVLNLASEYDYKAFYKKESLIRELTCFPPFSTIVRVMVESPDDQVALNTLKEVFDGVKAVYEYNKDAFAFFNKMKCPVKRIKNKYRYEILSRIKNGREDVIEKIYNIVDGFDSAKALVYVEENPSSMI